MMKDLHNLPLCVFVSLLIYVVLTPQAEAKTEFYMAIPDIIQDLDGVTLSVEIHDENNFHTVSWNHNGSTFIPNNMTIATEPDYHDIHLDNNDFLLAINDVIEPGTRLYMCIDIPYPVDQFDCQWDAVDKNNRGFAEFDLFFQSHKDDK
jgi:hypothetical protein